MNGSIVLRDGWVVDGSGAPGRTADVVLAGDRIVDIAPPGQGRGASGSEVIDCLGLVIAPGFIDVHTHDDAVVIEAPMMLPKLSQGVTTVVVGNCGISLAPLVTESPIEPLGLLGREQFCHASLTAYAEAVDAARPAVNVAALIGHTSLRACVMSDLSRAADARERELMAAAMRQAMDEGAFGVSSGVFYANAYAADEREIVAIAREAGAKGGVYATHIRDELAGILDAMQEAAQAAGSARVPLIFSHHKCAGPANWGRVRETLALIDRIAGDQPVGLDVYPYTAGSTVLREDLVDGVIDILITHSQPHPEFVGWLLADIARHWGVSEGTACRRLQPGGACYFQMNEDDVQRVLKHPLTMIGSDGLPHDARPHPRLWGAFPRVLGHYCRELGLLGLEEAVHKMTGLSAARFGLSERGTLRPGHYADVVVFDPRRIVDRATFANPGVPSEGVVHVFVNGRHSYAEGEGGGEGMGLSRAGRFLRRAGSCMRPDFGESIYCK